MMAEDNDNGNIYLGFDLSTQQLKGIAVRSNLTVAHEAKVDFDQDLFHYGSHKGVLADASSGEVCAPPAMWLEALDLLLERLRGDGMEFSRVVGVSAAGMQHGIVFWNHNAEALLSALDSQKRLVEQLTGRSTAFSYEYSPNWQDSSTQLQCEAFNSLLPGGAEELAQLTGSKAHHRFSGPQILRFRENNPNTYKATARISLVSSFLACVFLGKFANLDISDCCGMNLWDVHKGAWNKSLLALVAGSENTSDIEAKLGEVSEDGGHCLGNISKYFVSRYGFHEDCKIIVSTGDNPATVLALPLKASDAIVSLGTSTTFLMLTPYYKPDPSYHFFNSPTTAGLYMFMLCYKNGSLAREQIRDELNSRECSLSDAEKRSWSRFNDIALRTPPLSVPLDNGSTETPRKLGLYFPRHEIVPDIPPGIYRYIFDPSRRSLAKVPSREWQKPRDDVRTILESQLLSLRLRSMPLVSSQDRLHTKSSDGVSESKALPSQPRRIYLVGGGSVNPAITRLVGDVLGGSDGVYRLDIGGNACALGAAYKAVWACERQVCNESSRSTKGGRDTENFEDLIERRWTAENFVKKIDQGYRPGIWERYGEVLEGFRMMEDQVLKESIPSGQQ